MAKDVGLAVRVDEELLARLDLWRREQVNPPSRPAAIRQLLEKHLPKGRTQPPSDRKGRRR